jgi:hypothetical protein
MTRGIRLAGHGMRKVFLTLAWEERIPGTALWAMVGVWHR